MEIDLDELERLARAAHRPDIAWFTAEQANEMAVGNADCALIAAANPDVVLTLAGRLRAAELRANANASMLAGLQAEHEQLRDDLDGAITEREALRAECVRLIGLFPAHAHEAVS